MKTKLLLVLFLLLFPLGTKSVIVYNQPPTQTGALFQSSWWNTIGSDYDKYVWDNFTLPKDLTITEIRWRGGFDPAKSGSGGPVVDFSIAVYPSIPAGTQPDVVNPPLVQYLTGGNAGQTSVGTFGGVPMFDYAFVLPVPFQASAGTHYWVQIEACQNGIPDWGISVGIGGDNSHYLRFAYVGDIHYQAVPGDAAFTLLGPNAPYTIFLPLTQK